MDFRDLEIMTEQISRRQKNRSPWEVADGRKGWGGELLTDARFSVLIIF